MLGDARLASTWPLKSYYILYSCLVTGCSSAGIKRGKRAEKNGFWSSCELDTSLYQETREDLD